MAEPVGRGETSFMVGAWVGFGLLGVELTFFVSLLGAALAGWDGALEGGRNTYLYYSLDAWARIMGMVLLLPA
ncbi:hypothetical protein AAGG49_22050, partial [Stenotrophomonas maltophilia]|uniref:hypothetical protein n=1 Tax=Stenotrophomonas maltophilia TaxID=40324 RepID=UPI00313DD03D